MKKLFLLVIVSLIFQSVLCSSSIDYSKAESNADSDESLFHILDPENLVAAYNIVTSDVYLQDQGSTPEIEKQWVLYDNGYDTHSNRIYTNGYGNFEMTFCYKDEYVNMVLAEAQLINNTNKDESLIPLIITLDYLFNLDGQIMDWLNSVHYEECFATEYYNFFAARSENACSLIILRRE